jgi:hypothetical protein
LPFVGKSKMLYYLMRMIFLKIDRQAFARQSIFGNT